MKNINYIFIFPPTIIDFSPIIGIPQLIGCLQSQGINSKVFDLNNSFLHFISNQMFAQNYRDYIEYIFSDNFIKNAPNNIRQYIDLNYEQKNVFKSNINSILAKSNIALKILKHKKYFYNPFLCNWAIETFINSINVLMKPNWKIEFLLFFKQTVSSSMNTNLLDIDIQTLIEYIKNENVNIYTKFYKEHFDEILNEKADCIGISINCYSQLIPALTLAYLIKKKSSAHINIGGSLFTYDVDNFRNLADYFKYFFDSISIGDSENTVIELSNYLSGKINIEDVNNLIILKENTITKNKTNYNNSVEIQPIESFEGYKLDEYFMPEIVLPIRSSNACYWNKCTYCNCSIGKNLSIKSPAQFVTELEFIHKTYNCNFFAFWDNAISPEYISYVADLLIEKNLNITYILYFKFEKKFTKNLFKKLKKSGLVKIHWGLDSASNRILKYIRKGTTKEVAIQNIKDAKAAGIFNFVHIIFGFPTETKEEIEQTISFLQKNKKYITTTVVSPSMIFAKGTPMYDDREILKMEINTTEDERMIYTQRAYNIFSEDKKLKMQFPWYRYSQITSLYCKKYPNFLFKYLDKYTIFMIKCKKLSKWYLKYVIKELRTK